MSTNIEWAHANTLEVHVMQQGQEAGDGQFIDTPLGLAVGPLIIEGDFDQLMQLLADAKQALVSTAISALEATETPC